MLKWAGGIFYLTRKTKKMKILIPIILLLLALSIFVIVIGKSISMRQNCTGYLELAADANTIEIAKNQLQKSIKYLEENNLTKGYTSILWKTPDEDIEFWYKNLKASESELLKVDGTTSSLEKTNILIKLRETLLYNGKNGDSLTVPDGLSRYPNNAMWSILICFASLIIIGLIFLLFVINE
jgi:hypothetical protein